ncbi:hypothetical protein [Ideonella sp.]|uniref:hypothetical protein n=1 Tax=Ideonella sp. TaxID=1929293 RepID=UPI0035B49709
MRVSRSTSPPAGRVSLPSMASRVPGPGASGPANLRQSANFLLGIKDEPGKAAAFQEAAQGGHDASLRFIADNVNPNLAYGSALNFGKALIGAGPMALKQNCVYCSKAADQNLEALASGNPSGFWVADKTSAGTLPQQGSVDRGLRPDDKLTDMLAAEIAPGSRGIISVPQRDTPAYSHAMNCVHADDGSIHVIDGQNSRVYDLSQEVDRQSFDAKFGHNGGPCVARFFSTGAAPRPTVGTDQGDWVHVS